MKGVKADRLFKLLSLFLALVLMPSLAFATASPGTEGVASAENEGLSVIAEKPLDLVNGRTYYISITQVELQNAAGSTYVLTYDSDKLELTDFAAQTRKLTITEGDVSGANMTILSHEDGTLRFKLTADGTAVATVVQFKALLDGNTTVKLGAGKNTRTVTGLVYPHVTRDYGVGEAFLSGFRITVELRKSFWTPAPDELKTTVVHSGTGSAVGLFTIEDVPFGEYVLYIKRPGYLVRAYAVSVSSEDADVIELTSPGAGENGVFRLWWGDLNGDYMIDSSDLMMMTECQNGMWGDPYYRAAADLNADGMVDSSDQMMLLGNLDRWSTHYPGAETVDYSR